MASAERGAATSTTVLHSSAAEHPSGGFARARFIGMVLTYVGLTIFGVLAVFPLLWIITVSLQASGGATLGIELPIPPHWSSYSDAISLLPLLTFLRNSAIITSSA